MALIKIFNSLDTNFSSNGEIAINPISCIENKKKSLNGWYIDVEIPIKYKEYIEQDKICVIKTKSKLKPQGFRINNIEKTQRTIKFQAEHVMFDSRNYFLFDVRTIELSAGNALIYINERTDNKSPFSISSNIGGIDTSYFIRKNLLESWQIIEERYGGYFEADNFDIQLKQNIGEDRGEVISYGKNMQGIRIYEDWSNVATTLCPTGSDGITLPEIYIKSDIKYEKPYTKTLQFETNLSDDEKTEENIINELRQKAINYVNENKYPKVSYETSANINGNTEIGDIITVKHPLVNILTEVLEYEYDNISERLLKIVFGNFVRDVKAKFDNIKETQKILTEKLNSQGQLLESQRNIINNLNKNGHTYIDDNEIMFVDVLPKEKAIHVMKLGLGGIAFRS